MANPWDAEHAVDRALAQRLIGRARPDLAELEPELVGRGWDVEVWRAGSLAFRFPRRALGVATVENEMRLLPYLAPKLSLEVPEPVVVGEPTSEFPHPWFGHAFIEGTTADRARLSTSERHAIAAPLGVFLRALHAISVDEACTAGAQPDELRRDLEVVRGRSLERLPALEASRFRDSVPRLRAALDRMAKAPDERDHVIHADLYARHLILDGGRLTAVIDWGDVCLGDRAVDLDVVYSFLPPDAHADFFRAYGDVAPEIRARARYFALNRHTIALLAYSLDVGDEPLLAEAACALAFALD